MILLDVSMPDLDGLETLRAIRSAHPSAQVIMLSGRQTPATIIEAVRLGAADYVLKPGDPEGLGEMSLEAAIRNALERESLSAEVARLGAQMPEDPDGAQLCWRPSVAMRPVMDMVERIADSDVDVLIRGESGVGKDVVARELHRRSDRRSKQFVKVNCAALPADLLESELFGHERGAFTGAGTTRVGKFEFAQHGTVMLDEIGEMPRGAAGQDPARAAGSSVHASRQQSSDRRQRARPRRHQPQPRVDDAGRELPRGPLLPAAGDRAQRAGAARSARGDRLARGVLPHQVRARLSSSAAAAESGR